MIVYVIFFVYEFHIVFKDAEAAQENANAAQTRAQDEADRAEDIHTEAHRTIAYLFYS